MTQDRDRETARTALRQAGIKHADKDSENWSIAIIAAALKAERERCVNRLKTLRGELADKRTNEQSPDMRDEGIVLAIAAIRAGSAP